MFRDNTGASRFEWSENGEIAYADYYSQGGALVLPHVEAAAALRGTGAAGRLMQAMTDHARVENLKFVPRCGYAVAWFRRHAEAADVLA